MKKKILNHTSVMIVLAVLVTFLAASVVTYNRFNTYMQQGVREEAQYICVGMEELGDSYLTEKLGNVSTSRVTLIARTEPFVMIPRQHRKSWKTTATGRNSSRQKKREQVKASAIPRLLRKRPSTTQ